MEVPFKLHRFIIGQKGAGVRRLMEDHDVNISVPPQADESDVLVVSGTPANVASAKEALLQRVEQILEEEEDRVSAGSSQHLSAPRGRLGGSRLK